MAGPNEPPDDLLFTLPRPDPAWFIRSSGHRADGTIHGVRHARRVGVHALELAAELGATPEEREALRLAALWHDIGRECDGGDYFHGARSAGKVLGLGLHHGVERDVLDLALFAITYHPAPDGRGELAAQEQAEPRAALRVLRILKDADALDRVRFGPGHLKLHLLRFPESRCRIDRAFELVRATEEEGP